MIQLRTLGSVDLRVETGTRAETVLRQPKRLALLIYLALNPQVYHRRDRLLALFWPESDEKSARGALNQAVFQLRSALGKETVVNRGDEELAIGEGVLWNDVVQFNAALNCGDARAAMELYRGELLPSFTVADAPEFENWLSEQRRTLARKAADACLQVAAQAEAEGSSGEALQWLRRAVDLQPLYEGAHQKLIAALDRSGDRAGALHAFESLRALLREEFGVEPSAETLAIVQRVRTRITSREEVVAGEPSATVTVGTDAAAPAKRDTRRAANSHLQIALASVLVIAAAVWGAITMKRPHQYQPPADHVAVLYFADQSPHRDLGYLSESLTSTLIDRLGQVHQLRVISENGVRPFRGSATPIDSISRLLDAGTIVGGSVTESGGRLRVVVEMINGPTGVVMQTRTLERPKGELFALLDDLSNEVSAFLRTSVGQEVRLAEWRSQTRNVEAWRTLQEAEYMRANAKAREDAGNLSEAQLLLARSDSLAARAFGMDHRFASALVLRGRVAEQRGWIAFLTGKPRDAGSYFAIARNDAEQALSIDDQDATAYELRGAVNYWTWLSNSPQGVDSLLEAGERDLRQSLRLSSERPRAESVLSTVLYTRGKFAEARAAALRALEADAYLADADQIVTRLFETSFEIGDDVEAGHWCDEVRRRAANHWESAWCDLVLLAWSREGNHDPRKAIHLLETFGADDTGPLRDVMRPRLAMLSAAVVARAGMRDSAQAMLKRASAQAPNDAELLELEARARMLMGDQARAITLLRDYVRLNPHARERILHSRIFRNVAGQIS